MCMYVCILLYLSVCSQHDPTSAAHAAEALLCGEHWHYVGTTGLELVVLLLYPHTLTVALLDHWQHSVCHCRLLLLTAVGADVPSLETFEPAFMRPAPPLHVSSDEVRTLLCVCTCLTATGVAVSNNFQNSIDCHLICNTHVRMCVHVGMVCGCASVGISECNSPVDALDVCTHTSDHRARQRASDRV